MRSPGNGARAAPFVANVPDYFRKKSVRQRGFPSIGNLRCKDGKYLSSAASAQAHFWAPFCDAVGLPEMRDTRLGGDANLIRKIKKHMLVQFFFNETKRIHQVSSSRLRGSRSENP